MKPAAEDLKERRPLWKALSELYLDTETAGGVGEIVRAIIASPYSMAEVERILVQEVHPVCHLNLRSPAGVWAGFDLEWLEKKILEGPGLADKVTGKLVDPKEITGSEEWKEIRRRVAAIFEQMSEGVRPTKCPCGSHRIATVLYGELVVTPDLKRQMDEGNVVSGGCVVGEDDPLWRCVDCGKDYR